MTTTEDGLCRHCRRARADRPRGLCWRCYCRRAVRDLYPAYRSPVWYAAAGEPTEAELDAVIAAQRPTMPHEPGDPGRDDEPGAWWSRRRPPRGCDDDPPFWQLWRAAAARPPAGLHPATEPGAVATAQRRACVRAVAELGPGWTADAVSDLVTLPPDVCRRRLREAGLL